jgi:hypothetical protein
MHATAGKEPFHVGQRLSRRHVQGASSARPARATQYLRGWPEDAASLGAHPCSRLSNPSFVKSSSWRPYAPAGRTRRCCSHRPDNYKTPHLTTLFIAVPLASLSVRTATGAGLDVYCTGCVRFQTLRQPLEHARLQKQFAGPNCPRPHHDPFPLLSILTAWPRGCCRGPFPLTSPLPPRLNERHPRCTHNSTTRSPSTAPWATSLPVPALPRLLSTATMA